MKRLIAVLSVAAFTVPVHAQMKGMDHGDMKGMDMKSDKKATPHKATGVVTKADGKGKVTIKHEPVQSLNWPTMTMAFVVKDKSLADKLKPGAKIDFEFVQEGKDYVVTKVK